MPVYTYIPLDDPSANGGTDAYGINNAGQIVGSYEVLNRAGVFDNHGFLYSGGTYTTLDDPSVVTFNFQRVTVATGINASDQIVGSYVGLNGTNGFLYSGIFITLDDPLAGAGVYPQGINASGQIVGSYGSHGFLYSNGTYTTLDDPAGGFTQAYGINDLGQVVGTYVANGLGHGFLYSGGFFTNIDDPAATFGTTPRGINDTGQIVGFYTDSAGNHGFLYSGGTYTTLDDPSGTDTIASSINDAGQIVGTYNTSTGTHGFLLTITPNPPPPGGTTADMILRASNSSMSAGQYEIYDIGNNAILAGYSLGQVGTDWEFVTIGGFFGSDTSDMLLRNSNTGGFEVYDISDNNITNAAFLGTVGLEWQVMGFG